NYIKLAPAQKMMMMRTSVKYIYHFNDSVNGYKKCKMKTKT
ncbi:MAG: hypothetical protein PWQ75_2574, partial [Methanolobus sp.]|nr:hypothetical protein [Methanolobus sp.]